MYPVEAALTLVLTACIHRADEPFGSWAGLGLSIMVLLLVVFIRMRMVMDPEALSAAGL